MPDYGIGSWPQRRARICGSAIALRQGERVFTYFELARRVELLAQALGGNGVRAGDRVGYLGPNDLAGLELFFAAGRLGAVFVPLNTRLTAREIAYSLDDARPAVLVFGPECASTVVAAEPAARGVGLVVPVAGSGYSYADLMASGHEFDVVQREVGLDDDAVVRKFDAGEILRLIERLRVTSFSAVPTMLQMLCDHPDFGATDLSSLRIVIYGGSPIAERVAAVWQRRGVQILQGYGMTEASPGVLLAVPGMAADRPLSAGVAHFFTDVSLASVGPETPEAAVEHGQPGELLVRGLNVFRGYFERPDDSRRALAGGWFRSGDLVSIDDDGWSHVTGRVKDLIISGGENIYPAEVEAAINALPFVSASAVIGFPDDRWGEVGFAFVVADDGAWTAESMREALAGHLAAFKIPRHIRFAKDLPVTATGKVRREDLRAAAGLPVTASPPGSQ